VVKEIFPCFGPWTRIIAKHRRRAFRWRLVLVVILLAAAQLAQAAPAGGDDGLPIHFDLRAQALEGALAAFSELTGYSVLVSSSLTSGRQAAAVQGDLDPRDALQRLLADSGLVIRYVGARAFTLVPASANVTAHDGSTPQHAADAAEALERGRAAAELQGSITRLLCLAQPETFGRYRIGFQLWFGENGKVRDVRLLESSGVTARDAAVLGALRGLAIEALPSDLPQPVTILLTPRPNSAGDCLPYR